VAVTALSPSGALCAAARAVLRGDVSPVAEGILEPRIAGESSRDDAAFAGVPSDWCSKGFARRDGLVAAGRPIPV
jgi:hypothetical protein